MVTTDFSGRDVIKVLTDHGYRPVDHTGSHVKLRWESSDTDEVRIVTVPLYDRIPVDILQNIATQCGAEEFDRWCGWIEGNR